MKTHEAPPPRSVTSGSATRAGRPLRRPLIVDLAEVSASLEAEPQWASGDRNSMTVATTDRLRVTLTAIRGGAELGSPELSDTLTVQVLRGQIRLRSAGMEAELRAGQLGTLEDAPGWKVNADTDSLLLLTAAPGDASESRGG